MITVFMFFIVMSAGIALASIIEVQVGRYEERRCRNDETRGQ